MLPDQKVFSLFLQRGERHFKPQIMVIGNPAAAAAFCVSISDCFFGFFSPRLDEVNVEMLFPFLLVGSPFYDCFSMSAAREAKRSKAKLSKAKRSKARRLETKCSGT